MKKLFLGLTAIVIVITGIFAFAGCEKEENTDKTLQKSLSYQELHNLTEAVDETYSIPELSAIAGFNVVNFANSNSVLHFLESSYNLFLCLSEGEQDLQTTCCYYSLTLTAFEEEIINEFPNFVNLSTENKEIILDYAEDVCYAPGKIKGYNKFMKKVTALQELRNENSPHNSCITYQEYVEQYNYWVDWINKKNKRIVFERIS